MESQFHPFLPKQEILNDPLGVDFENFMHDASERLHCMYMYMYMHL